MELGEEFDKKVYVIGISGGSASGKTSVAKLIFEKIGIKDCVLFSMDSYYRQITEEERKKLSEYNFDHPKAFDFDLLYNHLCQLTNRQEIQMPIYNFTYSKREDKTHTVRPANVLIFEGILAFYDNRIVNLMDMLIFVDTDDDIRLARRNIRERGRNVAKVLERYMKFVKPAFDEYIKPTRKLADIIIPRGMENEIAIEVVIQHINLQLNKYFKTNDVQLKNQTIESLKFAAELSDAKNLPFSDRLTVYENEKDTTVIKIFEDILGGNRLNYTGMFMNNLLDFLVKLMIKKFNPSKYPFTFINDFKKEEQPSNNILYFKPCIINNEDFDKIKGNQLFTGMLKENVNVYFVSLIASPSCVENLLNEYKSQNLHFITLLLTKRFTSSHEIFSSLKEFSDTNLQKNFVDMINFFIKAVKIKA